MQKNNLQYTSYGKKKKWYQLNRVEIVSILIVIIALIALLFAFKQPIGNLFNEPINHTPGMGMDCSSGKGGYTCEPAYDDPPEQIYDGYDTTRPTEDHLSECTNYMTKEECDAEGL